MKRQPGRGQGELIRLRARLAEAEETLQAIRCGQVDAIAVTGPEGQQIYTLQSREHRLAEEALRESQELLCQALEKEKEAAREDSLTHIANRRAFQEVAEIERKRACRYARPLSLAYIDADNFKQVNDTLGHAEGDRLLLCAAKVLKNNVRSSDTVARLGGDEFAVLLPETDSNGATVALQHLHYLLQQQMAACGWPVTFSIGAVSLCCFTGTTEEMINAADRLMYRVKQSGKNGIVVQELGPDRPLPEWTGTRTDPSNRSEISRPG